MFGYFSNIRFVPSVAIMLTVALLACTGCQCLTRKPSVPAPPPIPPVVQMQPIQSPTMEEPDRYSAFRPIMPGQFMPPILSAQTVPIQETTSEPPKVEFLPDTAAQSKIDELIQRIAELETQLAESQKIPPSQTEKADVLAEKHLPIIDKQGVFVYADEWQNVRIEVMDKTLFAPNVLEFSAEGEETLRAIAAEIRASDPTAILDIEGHTDSLMSDPNNPMQKHEIASAKTAAVMEFFVNVLRWDPARIGTSSYGRSRPVTENGTPEGRARNNRIEIVVRTGGSE